MSRTKTLVKKFSLNQLEKESQEQGWRIPFAGELDGVDIPYDMIWVADQPEMIEDRGTHGFCYDVKEEKLILTNRSWMQHAVVFRNGAGEKNELFLAINPIVTKSIELLDSEDDEKLMGRMMKLAAEAEKEQNIDAMLELAIITKLLDIRVEKEAKE